jgi:hypothetical protein
MAYFPGSNCLIECAVITFERKKVGQTEDGFAGDSTVLYFYTVIRHTFISMLRLSRKFSL